MLRQERRVSLLHVFEDLLAVRDDLPAQLTESDPDPESTGDSLNLHTGLDDRPASLLSDLRVRPLLLFQLHCSHSENVHISLGK